MMASWHVEAGEEQGVLEKVEVLKGQQVLSFVLYFW